MFNKFNKNIASLIKHVPHNLSSISSKIYVYLGLTAYWGIILVGTFFNL